LISYIIKIDLSKPVVSRNLIAFADLVSFVSLVAFAQLVAFAMCRLACHAQELPLKFPILF